MKKMYKLIASAAFIGSMVFSTNINAQWTAMGAGISSGEVYTLQGFGSDVIVGGGYFSPYTDVAIWNGSSYSSAGFTPTQGLLAMAAFDSVVYIATYNAIYQHIGSSTIQIATLNDPCYALCFWNHKLYAGGWMNTINSVKLGYLDQYDPTTATWDSIPVEVDSWPKAMCVYNGQLAVAGYMNYTSAGDTLYGVGLWNGTKWTPLNKGIKGSGGVYAITTLGPDLYIGGQFDSASTAYKYGPHVFTNNIAVWNGTTWDSVGSQKTGGPSSTVYALTTFNGGVVAGGYFDSIPSWNGSVWSQLGNVTLTTMTAEVNAFTVLSGNLYAGGFFDHVGGIAASNVAEFTKPTAVNEVNNNENIRVYPNPSNGVFTIESLAGSRQSSVEIYNVLGEKVLEQLSILNSQFSINLSNQPAGIYVYRILSQDGSFISSGKMVKQ
jgi:hypothetical protein